MLFHSYFLSFVLAIFVLISLLQLVCGILVLHQLVEYNIAINNFVKSGLMMSKDGVVWHCKNKEKIAVGDVRVQIRKMYPLFPILMSYYLKK